MIPVRPEALSRLQQAIAKGSRGIPDGSSVPHRTEVHYEWLPGKVSVESKTPDSEYDLERVRISAFGMETIIDLPCAGGEVRAYASSRVALWYADIITRMVAYREEIARSR